MVTEQAMVATRWQANGVVKNITYLFGGQVATWLLAAAWTVVVPRQIGPVGMGELVTLWSVTGILSVIVGLGMRTLVVTDIARDPASAGRSTSAAIAARLVLFVPAAALMAVYLHFSNFSHYQVLLLAIGTITLPLTLVHEVLLSAFQGLERMQYLAYLDVIPKTFSTAGAIVLVLLGFRVLGLVILGASAVALALAISAYWARSHYDFVWRPKRADVTRAILKSMPYWATTIIGTIYLWIDSFMLAILASATEVGWYGVPTKLFATLLFIPSIISTATLARLTANFAAGHDVFRRTLTPIVESTLVISLPVAAGTAAVAGPLVSLLYGPAYRESASVLVILALTVPATYLNIVVNQSLVASNRQILWTKVMAVSVVINVALNAVAIPLFRDRFHNGALGAAWSLLATEMLMALVGLFLVRASLDATTVGRVGRTAVASLTMGVAVHAMAFIGAAGQVAVGILIFVVLAFAMRLVRPAELAVARGYARGLQGRLASMVAR